MKRTSEVFPTARTHLLDNGGRCEEKEKNTDESLNLNYHEYGNNHINIENKVFKRPTKMSYTHGCDKTDQKIFMSKLSLFIQKIYDENGHHQHNKHEMAIKMNPAASQRYDGNLYEPKCIALFFCSSAVEIEREWERARYGWPFRKRYHNSMHKKLSNSQITFKKLTIPRACIGRRSGNPL